MLEKKKIKRKKQKKNLKSFYSRILFCLENIIKNFSFKQLLSFFFQKKKIYIFYCFLFKFIGYWIKNKQQFGETKEKTLIEVLRVSSLRWALSYLIWK